MHHASICAAFARVERYPVAVIRSISRDTRSEFGSEEMENTTTRKRNLNRRILLSGLCHMHNLSLAFSQHGDILLRLLDLRRELDALCLEFKSMGLQIEVSGRDDESSGGK